MPPEPIITETTPRPDLRRYFHVRTPLLLGLAAAGVVMVATPLLISKYRAFITPTVEAPTAQVEVVREPEVLGGKIYMSLAPKAANTHFALNVYSYDADSGLIQQETGENGREYFTSAISPDGTQMAFASISNDGHATTSDVGIFVRTIDSGDVVEVEAGEDAVLKRTPEWSPDGSRLAFSGLMSAGSDEMIPENWGVYIFEKNKSVATRVAVGTNPRWLPSGDLVILKNDGLYHRTTAGGAETKISALTLENARTNMRFDISQDGKKLAWAFPGTNELLVINVASWDPFVIESTMKIAASTFWPVFSPLGDYLAMQVFNWSDETPERIALNQQLAIFSLRENTWLSLTDLTPYYQDMLFITDWQPVR